MMQNSVPLGMVQQVQYNTPAGPMAGMPPGAGIPAGVMMPPGGITPAGMPPMPGMGPAMMPGMNSGRVPAGVVAGAGMLTGANQGPFPASRTEVRFGGPSGMKISWYQPGPDGKNTFMGTPIEAPGRYNFVQAAIYRVKLSDIPGRPGLELYPTIEVVPANAKSAAFLAHSSVPLNFTEEDFAQVTAGNFVVKVIYLPDPQFQDLATTGPEEIISSRLEPGVDPIAQAHCRGSILLVVRLGNIDLEAPNTPAMDAPSPYMMKPQMPVMMPGHTMGPAGAVPPTPYGAAGQPMLPQGAGALPPGIPTGGPGMLPPAQGTSLPPTPASSPTSMRLPDASGIQQTQYRPTFSNSVTPASLAGQPTSGR
jgi:hypothetical protein